MVKCFPIPLFQFLLETRSPGGAEKEKWVEEVGRQGARGEGRVGAMSPRARRGRQDEASEGGPDEGMWI